MVLAWGQGSAGPLRDEGLKAAVAAADEAFGRWVPDLEVAGQVAVRAMRRGDDPTEAVDTMMTILRHLELQVAGLEVGFERMQPVDPPVATLDRRRSELGTVVRAHRDTIIAGRLAALNAAVQVEDHLRAQERAQGLERDLGLLERRGGPDPRFVEVRRQLARIRGEAPPGEEPPSWIEPPGPAHLGWRVGVQWTLPVQGQTYEGAPVRRSAAAGAVGLAIAPVPAGCVEARVAWDRWRAPDHPQKVGQDRWRVELGYCPRVVSSRIKSVTLGIRPVVGLGLGGGRLVTEGAADLGLVRWGVHGRIEAPLLWKRLELAPSVGLAPYGRPPTSGDRAPFPATRAMVIGLVIGVGGDRD